MYVIIKVQKTFEVNSMANKELEQVVEEELIKLMTEQSKNDEWFDVDTLDIDLEKTNKSLYDEWSKVYDEVQRYEQICKVLDKFFEEE
jgi:hypothetical protein